MDKAPYFAVARTQSIPWRQEKRPGEMTVKGRKEGAKCYQISLKNATEF